MAGLAETNGGRRGLNWRVIAWGTAALLLLLPLVAMQFTDEVNWTGSDFIVMGALFGTVGLGFELAIGMSSSWAWRAGAGVAIVAAFLLVWVNLAVGMIGSEDNPFNLLFGGVIAVALAGAAAARFRPEGMARAMAAAAVAQAAIGLAGLATDPRGGMLSMVMAGLWLIAAWLFRKAAREQRPAGAGLEG
jgi:hypothetical protein